MLRTQRMNLMAYRFFSEEGVIVFFYGPRTLNFIICKNKCLFSVIELLDVFISDSNFVYYLSTTTLPWFVLFPSEDSCFWELYSIVSNTLSLSYSVRIDQAFFFFLLLLLFCVILFVLYHFCENWMPKKTLVVQLWPLVVLFEWNCIN